MREREGVCVFDKLCTVSDQSSNRSTIFSVLSDFFPTRKKKNLRVENISTAFLCHTNKDSILVLVVVVKFSTHRTTVPRIPATYFTRFEASISDFWY